MNKNDNSGKEKTWKKAITILSCVAIVAIVGFAVYQHDKNTPTITATITVPTNEMSPADEKLNDLVKAASDKMQGLDKLDKNLNGLVKAQQSAEPTSIQVKVENVRMTFEQSDANGNVDTVLMTENLPSATPITGKIKACGFTVVMPDGERINFKIASVVTHTRAKCTLLRTGDTTTISREKNGGWYWFDEVDGRQE